MADALKHALVGTVLTQAEYESLLGSHTFSIEHHTSSDTLATTETGSVHTNLGAGAAVKLTLPQDAAAGCLFWFAVMVAQQLQIDAGAAGAIYIGGSKQADDAYIWADAIGESVMLVCDGSSDWISLFATGTWTVV